MNSVPQKYNDCYFYFYSSCNKGKQCPFRHSSAALGTENVCELWKDGKCLNSNCEYRHMNTTQGKKRETIPCFWENQPSGCLKVHCPFSHTKPRPNEQSANLILPLKAPEIKITAPKPHVLSPAPEIIEAQSSQTPNHLHPNTGIKDDSFHLSIKLDENSDDESSPMRGVEKLHPLKKTKAKMMTSPRQQLKPRNIQDRLGLPNNSKRSFDNNQKKHFKLDKDTNNIVTDVGSIHIKTLDEIRRERAAQQQASDDSLNKNDLSDSGDSSKENKLYKRSRDDLHQEEIQTSLNDKIQNSSIIETNINEDLTDQTQSLPSENDDSNIAPEQKKIKLTNSAENHLDFIDDILGGDPSTVDTTNTSTTQTNNTTNDSKSTDWMKADFPELFDI